MDGTGGHHMEGDKKLKKLNIPVFTHPWNLDIKMMMMMIIMGHKYKMGLSRGDQRKGRG
jgi:hypothetical protein